MNNYREQFEAETDIGINTILAVFQDTSPVIQYIIKLESRLAAAEERTRWRDVLEELPDDKTRCAVSDGEYFSAAIYRNFDGFITNDAFLGDEDVTYWLPIP